ncbi:hypothetical protein AVEN_72634-1 [Araneus ventricosus]|uniref:Innexin n=1 Tax=Araneus ventricosus TaxID=182803 RepID=A0A4Y2QF50_ARAVE|nr:hypothetical protein AVEN_144133-1 [Araneus ventricosus]GBN61753.1 hypothetical protein AVEN_72634-1 [Araneus ventricosus]
MHLKSLFGEYPVIDSFEVRLHSFATTSFSIFFCMSLCGLMLSYNALPGDDVNQILQNSSIFLESFSSHSASIEHIQQGPDSNYLDNLGWLYTILSLNIFLSCFPRLFWEYTEGGLVGRLTKFVSAPQLSNRSQEYHGVMLTQYLMETRGTHGFYFLKCIVAEFCTLVSAICQVFLIKSIFCQKIYKYILKADTHSNFPAWCSDFVGCANSYGICVRNAVRENDGETVFGSYIDYIETWIFFGFLVLFFIITHATLYLVMRRIQAVFHPELLVNYHKGYRKSINTNYQASDWFLLDLLKNNMDPYEFRFIVNELEIDLSKKYE